MPQPAGKLAQRRRRRRLGALAAACVVTVTAVGRLTGAGPAGILHPDARGVPVSFAGGRPTEPPSGKPLARGWRLVRRAPIAARHAALSTWTGQELLIWGGTSQGEQLDDGAAYTPDTDQWRPIPPAPMAPREGASQVWTGREWIIWGGDRGGGYTRDGAAYNPVSRAWRTLPPAPIRSRAYAAAVWTGQEVLVWGGGAGRAGVEATATGAAYDPEQDRWRRLPAGPLGHRAVWMDTEMMVWGDGGSAAAFNPVLNRWRALPDAPFAGFAPTLVWTGTEVLAVGESADGTNLLPAGAAYHPATGRWRTLAAAPEGVDLSDFTATWAGHLLVMARGPSRIHVYDPARDSWAVMPGLSDGPRVGSVAVWTGDEMVFWGGYGVLGTPPALEEGVAWQPE